MSTKLKIGMIIPSFRPIVGGAERQLEGLLENFNLNNVSVTVFTRMVQRCPKYEKLPTHDLYRLSAFIPKMGFGISLFLHLIWFRRKFDLIHCHSLSGQSSLICVLIGVLLRKPVILKVTRSGEDAQIANLKKSFFGRILLSILKNGTTKFIAITGEVKNELINLDVHEKKIKEIPNGVDVFKREKNLNQKSISILTIGRLIDRKRIDMLIDLIPEVNKTFEVTLTIAGSGPNEKKLMKQAKNLQISEKIIFLGEIEKDEIEYHLAQANIFVLPSSSEGMSNALLEAMSAGLPSIVANIAANRTLIMDGKTGKMFTDSSSLKKAIIELCHDFELRESIGKSAQNLINEKYSFNKIANDYYNLYSEILNEL